MPRISYFYGIKIYMYWNDHSPPHFHAKYQGEEVLLNINTLEVIDGYLPKTAINLVLQWAFEHRAELMDNWNRCINKQDPFEIEPLN